MYQSEKSAHVLFAFFEFRVIPIIRGAGLSQEGVIRCVEILSKGGWIHIFSEGKVNQTKSLLPFRVSALSLFFFFRFKRLGTIHG
jgi:hypothetical protein